MVEIIVSDTDCVFLCDMPGSCDTNPHVDMPNIDCFGALHA